VNGSIQELLERSPFLEGLDRRDLVELPQLGVGEGFPVRRAFAGVDLAALDPFVHMDQMGEVNYARGEPKGTPWHPHRASRPSPTCSTAFSATRTPMAVAG
jgi:hypothetical protein